MPECAWPVADLEDPQAYAAALREVLGDLPAAFAKARHLRELMLSDRSEEHYADHALDVLLGVSSGEEEPS